MSSTINLLPCPFCNNAEIAINNENPKDNSGGYFIECPGCGASTSLRFACGDDPTSLLAEQWNRRATSHCLHQIQEPAAGLQQLIAEINQHMRAEWDARRLPAECWPTDLARRVRDAAAGTASTQAGSVSLCTCPSGDGSLRWPCPAHSSQAVLDYPWRDRLLDGRPLERDKAGFAEHPELPQLDEGMRAKAFYAALGVEVKHTMAEDDLSMDEYDAMNEAVNWSNWAPKPPSSEAWNLVAIFDTEDGPAAWWMRELPFVPKRAEGYRERMDNAAVEALSVKMKAKLADQRAKGYRGWNNDCTQQHLSDLLRQCVDKGDPVDVANFCAFLQARCESIAPQAHADARDAGKLHFWVADDPDTAHESLHEAVMEAFETSGVQPGGFVEIQREISLPNILVRITSTKPFAFEEVPDAAIAAQADQQGGAA